MKFNEKREISFSIQSVNRKYDLKSTKTTRIISLTLIDVTCIDFVGDASYLNIITLFVAQH